MLFLSGSDMSEELSLNINIKEPRWDQGTFMGRAQHFFTVTDPRNILLSSETLEEAKVIVESYRWWRTESEIKLTGCYGFKWSAYCTFFLYMTCYKDKKHDSIFSLGLLKFPFINSQHFQSWDCQTWLDRRWTLESQVHLRLCLPPRHGREDVCDRPDVCSGANEHVHHRLHAHLLQVQQSFSTHSKPHIVQIILFKMK